MGDFCVFPSADVHNISARTSNEYYGYKLTVMSVSSYKSCQILCTCHVRQSLTVSTSQELP
jgi:hypothetical protein